MLQQTTVAAVTPRFERFLTKWPTVEALAAARDEDVLSEWAGLGYYARARNLIACAREVAKRGGFPDTESELLRLPGIGAYTAAAIAAIAFGRRALVLDTNVERVIARLNGISAPAADTKDRLRELLDDITPQNGAGDFAQALMDLGATICRPKVPNCAACPLQEACVAFASGEPERFPGPKRKVVRPTRFGVAHWIEHNGHVWLVRRPSKGMLGAMAALPGPEWSDTPHFSGSPISRVTHVFTHFRLELAIVACDTPTREGWWQSIDSLVDAGLPTLYRRAVESVLATRSALAA